MSTIPVEHDETLSLILRCRTLTQYLGTEETVAILLAEGIDEESARLCAAAGEMAAAWHSLLRAHSSVIQLGLCQFHSHTLEWKRDVTPLVFSLALVTLNHGPHGSRYPITHGELSSSRGTVQDKQETQIPGALHGDYYHDPTFPAAFRVSSLVIVLSFVEYDGFDELFILSRHWPRSVGYYFLQNNGYSPLWKKETPSAMGA